MRRHSCVLLLLLSIVGLALSGSAQQVGPAGKQDSGFRLEQNYPNPFNPETKIPFVSMRIFSLTDGLPWFRFGFSMFSSSSSRRRQP